MTKVIYSQAEFDHVAQQLNYSDYREFSKYYKLNPTLCVKLTGTDVDNAWPRESTRKEIMSTIIDNLTVSEVNKRASEISKHAEEDADIFMALKKSYIVLETPYQQT